MHDNVGKTIHAADVRIEHSRLEPDRYNHGLVSQVAG